MTVAKQSVKVKKENGICVITLNRPEVRNALLTELREDLKDQIKKLQYDHDVKVIILTGEGSVFSAGGDLKALKNMNAIEGRKRLKAGHDLILSMVNIEKPIIAAVNGPAVGAGFSLALACDFIIASDSAVFSQKFSKRGAVPDLGSAYFISQLVGPYLAKRLMLLAEDIPAKKAYEWQIVSEVVSPEHLMDSAYSLANQLAMGPGIANGFTKSLVNKSVYGNLQEVLELEAFAQASLL